MFIETPASKMSIAKRKLVHGVGVNDAIYSTGLVVDGKTYRCPYYHRWSKMIARCYSINYQIKKPTYKGCSVCDEWLLFSNFRTWMVKQDWKNKQLDKDILIQGNKIYSPLTCIFVTSFINQLITDSKAIRGKLKRGVCFHKGAKKFKASISINDKSIHCGYFTTEDDASEAYKTAKYNHIKDVAMKQDEPLRAALLKWKILD